MLMPTDPIFWVRHILASKECSLHIYIQHVKLVETLFKRISVSGFVYQSKLALQKKKKKKKKKKSRWQSPKGIFKIQNMILIAIEPNLSLLNRAGKKF